MTCTATAISRIVLLFSTDGGSDQKFQVLQLLDLLVLGLLKNRKLYTCVSYVVTLQKRKGGRSVFNTASCYLSL